MMGLRLPELLIILVVLLLVFGANKIPQLGDALGKGIRNFKKASTDNDDTIDVSPKDEQAQLPTGSQAAASAQQSTVQPAQSKKA
ncbi:MAG: twin-arginine translocase TatA/TatE family subunit [Anaeromyxobacteraceae bacterium]